uniref:Uncharacterized protein n=1 Tax=Moorena producens (strain JHB) TaxID=1454205 RepID=A0A1D9FZP6_MOOP1
MAIDNSGNLTEHPLPMTRQSFVASLLQKGDEIQLVVPSCSIKMSGSLQEVTQLFTKLYNFSAIVVKFTRGQGFGEMGR